MFFGPEFNCSLCANFTSEYKLNIAERIFAVQPLLVSELLTFNVNCLLNNDSYKVGEILGVLLKRNVISKIQNYDETVLPSIYLTLLSRQLDNDDANDDENGIDIFSRTVSHQLSAAILSLFISAAIGYFA